MPRPYRTTLTSEQLSQRGRKAALARTSTASYAKKLADDLEKAPDLSQIDPAVVATLAAIFAPREVAGP